MPEALPPSVALVHPNQAQFERQYAFNGAEWRGALSQEAYMRRERYLATQGIATNSGLTYWALVDTAEDANSDKILAGCETIRKRALVSDGNGKVTRTTSHGICSVFTPPNGRGKGAASRMIREVTKVLESWQQDLGDGPCLFAVLYSDIGKTFYAREGWKPYESAHIHLPPIKAITNSSPIAKPLYEKDLQALCLLDEQLLTKKLEAHRGGVAVALVPDHETMLWHHARENFVAGELLDEKPEFKGAVVTIEGQSTVWAIWSRFFYNPDPSQRNDNVLYILRLVVQEYTGQASPSSSSSGTEAEISAIAAVLSLAQKEAHEWNMEKVEIWNPEPRAIAAAQRLHFDAKVIHREKDSIASLKWYGEPTDEARLTWKENEKYAWC